MKLFSKAIVGLVLFCTTLSSFASDLWVTTDFHPAGFEPQVLSFDEDFTRSVLADFTGGYRRDQVIYNYLNDTVITLGGSYAIRRDMNYFSRSGDRLSYTFDLTGVPAWIWDAMIVKDRFVVGWAGPDPSKHVVFSSALNDPEGRLRTLELASILPPGGSVVSMLCINDCVFLFDSAGGVVMINFRTSNRAERGPFYFAIPAFAGIKWASFDGEFLWVVKDGLETWNLNSMFPDTWTRSEDLSELVTPDVFYAYSTRDGHTIIYSQRAIFGFVDENFTGQINLQGSQTFGSNPIIVDGHDIAVSRKYGDAHQIEFYTWPSSPEGEVPLRIIGIENPIVNLFTNFSPRRP